MSNPFVVEDLFRKQAVAEYINKDRYSGGVFRNSNPFFVADIAGRRKFVSAYDSDAGLHDYSAGEGLGRLGYTPNAYDIVNDNSFQGSCPAGYAFEGDYDPSTGSYGYCRKLGVVAAAAQKAGLPTWVAPAAGAAVVALGAFFVWKGIKGR